MENELFNSLLDRGAHRGCAAVLRAPKRKFHTGVGDLLDRSILQNKFVAHSLTTAVSWFVLHLTMQRYLAVAKESELVHLS